MIKACIEENSGFGILPSENISEVNIGSYVVVKELKHQYETGELDIIVQGIERFIATDIWTSPAGYHEVDVIPYPDISDDVKPQLIERAILQFKELLNTIKYEISDGFWENVNNTRLKSFKLAEKTGLTFEAQLQLLEMQEEKHRLVFLLQHFNKLKKYLTEKAVIESMIKNDGFLN